MEMSVLLGLEGPYQQKEKLPTFDHCGYEVALQMILSFTRPGKYYVVYQQ
jgi:hypothetical protein